ncbi:MAG: signal peptidase II [Bradymonadaceae bacterium]|nr:signal peptidase II [Lujinxingiaceae bacterium]
MKLGKTMMLMFVLLGSVGCDQVTKVVAREHLDGRATLSYLGDTFRLTYVENHGAFLGMGSTLPESVRTLIFVGLVSLSLAVFLFWVLRTSLLSTTTVVASGLLIGGGIGNLIDRVLFNGGVTDFLNIGIGTLRTGIFNVADVWIMAGLFLIVLSPELRQGLRAPPEEPDDKVPESP